MEQDLYDRTPQKGPSTSIRYDEYQPVANIPNELLGKAKLKSTDIVEMKTDLLLRFGAAHNSGVLDRAGTYLPDLVMYSRMVQKPGRRLQR